MKVNVLSTILLTILTIFASINIPAKASGLPDLSEIPAKDICTDIGLGNNTSSDEIKIVTGTSSNYDITQKDVENTKNKDYNSSQQSERDGTRKARGNETGNGNLEVTRTVSKVEKGKNCEALINGTVKVETNRLDNETLIKIKETQNKIEIEKIKNDDNNSKRNQILKMIGL